MVFFLYVNKTHLWKFKPRKNKIQLISAPHAASLEIIPNKAYFPFVFLSRSKQIFFKKVF